MKRSEMLNIIADFIQDFDMGGELCNLPYDQAADMLLTEIEELGMSPPITKSNINEWELEDAKET